MKSLNQGQLKKDKD